MKPLKTHSFISEEEFSLESMLEYSGALTVANPGIPPLLWFLILNTFRDPLYDWFLFQSLVIAQKCRHSSPTPSVVARGQGGSSR